LKGPESGRGKLEETKKTEEGLKEKERVKSKNDVPRNGKKGAEKFWKGISRENLEKVSTPRTLGSGHC